MSDKRDMIRAAAKLPRMSDEDVGRHMKEIGRRIRRQAIFDALLVEAIRG